jgi:hypothetical protein
MKAGKFRAKTMTSKTGSIIMKVHPNELEGDINDMHQLHELKSKSHSCSSSI